MKLLVIKFNILSARVGNSTIKKFIVVKNYEWKSAVRQLHKDIDMYLCEYKKFRGCMRNERNDKGKSNM